MATTDKIEKLKKIINRKQFASLFKKISKKDMPMLFVVDEMAEYLKISPDDVKDLIQAYSVPKCKQEVLIEKYGREGILKLYENKNITDLAIELKISMKTCRDMLKKLNIKTKKIIPKQPKTEDVLSKYTIDDLQKLYNDFLLPDVAEKVGISICTLRKIFKKYNIKPPENRFTPVQNEICRNYTKEELQKLAKTRTINELAGHLKISTATCLKVLNNFNLKARAHFINDIEASIFKKYTAKDIEEMHTQIQRKEIAKKLGISLKMLSKVCEKNNIKRPSLVKIKDFIEEMKKQYTREDILKMRGSLTVAGFCEKFCIEQHIYLELLKAYEIKGNKHHRLGELVKQYSREDILKMHETMTHNGIIEHLGLPKSTYYRLIKKLGVI